MRHITVILLLVCAWAFPASSLAGTGDLSLDAPFDNLALGPVGTGAAAGQPIVVSAMTANVIDTGSSYALEAIHTALLVPGGVWFEFIGDEEITSGTVCISYTVTFQALGIYIFTIYEQGSVGSQFSKMTLNAGGQISFFDQNNLVGAIATSSYQVGVPLEVLYEYDLDAGTYDVSLGGSLLLDDEDHGITTRGIGRLMFTNNAFSAGHFVLDDVKVQKGGAALAAGPGVVPGLGMLHAPQPNPMRSGTRVRFDLEQAGAVQVSVFDATGRRVRTLINGALGVGTHDIRWDGADDRGITVPAGLYFVRLHSGGQAVARKVIRVD